jgi:hypothetical protein
MSRNLAKDELVVAIYGAWHFWKERCMRVFQNTYSNKHQLMDIIKDDMLLLGSYLHEKLRENESGMQPELGE